MPKNIRDSLFDEKAPYKMVEGQKWFGGILEDPLFSPSGNYLSSPHSRLQIYHTQVWTRLCKCLQDHFPALTRLFGPTLFDDEIAKPYIEAHPPSDYHLNHFGDALPAWLEKNVSHHPLILPVATIDWALHGAFWAPHIKAQLPTSDRRLTLQPHIHLFDFPADFFTFRDALLQHPPDYFLTHPFPPLLPQRTLTIIYKHHTVNSLQLTEPEYFMLSCFRKGISIAEACALLESHPTYHREAATYLPLWFHQWTKLEWLK